VPATSAHRPRLRPIATALALGLGLGLGTVGCTADPDARASDESHTIAVSDAPPATDSDPASNEPDVTALPNAPDPLDPWKDPATVNGGSDPAVEEACEILERMAAGEAAAADLDGLRGELDQPLYDHGVLLQELAAHLQDTGGARQIRLATDLGLTGTAARAFAEDLMKHRAAGTEASPVLATELTKMLERLNQLMYDLRVWEVQICEDPAGSTVTRSEIKGVRTSHVEFHPSPWLNPSEDG
jgi:hypothetical protein